MFKEGLSYGLIQKFAVLYLVIWTISPPLQIGTIYRVAALGCAVIWFVVLFIREQAISFNKDEFLSILFLLLIIVVIYIEKGSISSVIKQIAYIMMVICFFMNNFYKDKADELKGIVQIVLILLIIFNFITISALIEDPTIARRIVRDDVDTYDFLKQGVGGYSLIYPQVCICPAVLSWTLKAFKQSKFNFFIGVIWAVSYIWFLSLAGYSIAVFASIVGATLFLFYKGKSAVVAFIVAIAIFIISMLSIMYIESFRNWLLEIFDGTAVTKKINDLVFASETGETGDSILFRINAYSESIKDIIKYPIIGSLWRESGGRHSEFLGIFSKYGLFGCFIFSKLFYFVPLYYKKIYNNKYVISTANATLITYLFVLILDTVTYSFTCLVLVVAPLFFEDIVKWTGADKNESFMDS